MVDGLVKKECEYLLNSENSEEVKDLFSTIDGIEISVTRISESVHHAHIVAELPKDRIGFVSSSIKKFEKKYVEKEDIPYTVEQVKKSCIDQEDLPKGTKPLIIPDEIWEYKSSFRLKRL